MGTDLTKRPLDGHTRPIAKRYVHAVSRYYDISPPLLRAQTRKRIYVIPRQMLIYLLYTEVDLRICQIGAYLQRDHSTATYAVEKMSGWVSSLREYEYAAQEINRIVAKNGGRKYV